MLQLASILVGLVVSTSSAPMTNSYVPLPLWQAEVGDRVIADTESNIGYIIHTDGRYTSMVIGSGRKQVVHYAGKTYDATTPETAWVARELNIQSDRQIFAASGRFLRLYMDGTESTSYGIHSVANINDILASDDRYKSFGCILVDDAMMDLLIKTYELNGNSLDVVTVRGIDKYVFAQ